MTTGQDASDQGANNTAGVGGERTARELQILAKAIGMEYWAKIGEPIPPRNLRRGDFDRIAGSWGRENSTVPILETEREVIVATSNPLAIEIFEQLHLCYRKPLKIVVTTPDEVVRAINAIRTTLMSDRSSELNTEEQNQLQDETQLKIDVTDAEDDDAPIIRYVNAIIFKANTERASDVHIEPYEDRLKVRFRVDGVLHEVTSEDPSFHPSIVSRIKIMSGLNIAEKRLPQDGRIGLKIAGKDVDIRVSTVPTQFGERVVLRLLDKSATVLDLVSLGLSQKNLALIEKLIIKPNGIILVTGPTGSGKTTTLYSCLSRIKSPGLNILTVEDPIEYQLDGIGQMQVNPKIGFSFATGLRAILRQDPNVVMVGEIRDKETAEIATQASLTGHLVLSTLHTNDSAGAISRLIDMGIEPFLVASSLLGVMAQRLIRRLCPYCKVPHELSATELKELGLGPEYLNYQVFKPKNTECVTCQNTGYIGRTSIHEILPINEEIRSLVLQRLDSGSIRSAAVKYGFEPLRLDGAHRVLDGTTSVEEILLATHEE